MTSPDFTRTAPANERPIEHEVIVVLHSDITVGMEDNDVHALFFGVEAVDGIGWNDKNFSSSHLYVISILPRATFATAAHNHAEPDGWMCVGFLVRSRRHMQVVETGVPFQHGMNEWMIGAATDVRKTPLELERTAERIHALVAKDADGNTPPCGAANASRAHYTEVIARTDNTPTAVMADLHFAFGDKTEVGGFIQKVVIGARHKTFHRKLPFWRRVQNAGPDTHR